MLDYPPPHSAPLFCLVSKEPCTEGPNRYLSVSNQFREIQGSKVCSTIRPLPLRQDCFAWSQRNHVWKAPTSTFHHNPPPHCFAWFQRNHVWKAPTSTFHHKLELPGLLQPVSRSKGPKPGLLQPVSRSKGPKCALWLGFTGTIRPLQLCATILLGLKGTMYGKRSQPVPFTSTFHQLELPGLLQPVWRSKGPKCADYPPTLRHCFAWFQRNRPNPPPTSARVPLPFAWSQRNHVWKAPTSLPFTTSLELPGLLQPLNYQVWRSKGPKCARLSAPSLCATVLLGFKGTMYGKPQPVPFTRSLNCQDCSNQFRDPRVQSVLDYPPPHSAPLFCLVSKEPCMESPNQYLSPQA